MGEMRRNKRDQAPPQPFILAFLRPFAPFSGPPIIVLLNLSHDMRRSEPFRFGLTTLLKSSPVLGARLSLRGPFVCLYDVDERESGEKKVNRPVPVIAFMIMLFVAIPTAVFELLRREHRFLIA